MTGVAAGLLGRRAILTELSPSAAFISNIYTQPIDILEYKNSANKILKEIINECGWMFKTKHTKNAMKIPSGKNPDFISESDIFVDINYVLWSDLLICPYCKNEYIFWDAAANKNNGKIKSKYLCTNCNSEITKSESGKAIENLYDTSLKKNIELRKQNPVLINYSLNGKRYLKKPDKFDFDIISKINAAEIPYNYPTNRMPEGD